MRLPTIGRMPRRIVSTSGSSGTPSSPHTASPTTARRTAGDGHRIRPPAAGRVNHPLRAGGGFVVPLPESRVQRFRRTRGMIHLNVILTVKDPQDVETVKNLLIEAGKLSRASRAAPASRSITRRPTRRNSFSTSTGNRRRRSTAIARACPTRRFTSPRSCRWSSARGIPRTFCRRGRSPLAARANPFAGRLTLSASRWDTKIDRFDSGAAFPTLRTRCRTPRPHTCPTPPAVSAPSAAAMCPKR